MAESPVQALRRPEELRHQRRAVRVEHLGWGVMLLFVVAALAGLVGPGPMSQAVSVTADGAMEVRFERFLRSGATTTLDVDVALDGPSTQPRVRLDADYLSGFSLQEVRPEPEQVISHGNTVEFVFAAPEESTDVRLAFGLRADEFGRRGTTVAAGDAGSVAVDHFVYP